MRRFISFLLVFAILSCVLSAVSIEEPLVFTATIPNDYGVSVPEGVILLDRFAISAKTIEGVEALIREDTFHVGTINEAEPGSMDFVLMYYGNLPVSYDVECYMTRCVIFSRKCQRLCEILSLWSEQSVKFLQRGFQF